MGHHGKAAFSRNIFPLDFWLMGFVAPWEWPSHALSHGGQAFHWNSRPVGKVVKAGDQSPAPYVPLQYDFLLNKNRLITLHPKMLSGCAPDLNGFALYEQFLKIGWRLQRTCITICHGKYFTMVSSFVGNLFFIWDPT